MPGLAPQWLRVPGLVCLLLGGPLVVPQGGRHSPTPSASCGTALEEGSLSLKRGMSHYIGKTLVTAPTERDVGEAWGVSLTLSESMTAKSIHGEHHNPTL